MEGRGVMRMGVTMTLYQAASDYWLRYRNSLSVRVSEGALTQSELKVVGGSGYEGKGKRHLISVCH